MTRSTVQPEPLRLWKLEATDGGLQLHISAHWNVHQVTIEDEQGTRQEWRYDSIRFVVSYEGSRDAISGFLSAQQSRLLLVAKTLWEAKHNQDALTAEESKELVDYATQERIRAQLHPLAGSGEEAKILREQLKAVLVKISSTPTVDFAWLNKIAVAAVEEAAAKKVAL